MRHKGDEFEFKKERNDDLMRAYTYQVGKMKNISTDELYMRIVDMPSKRFWVSPRRAAVVISSLLKGGSLKNMGRAKKQMYEEIYRRVISLRARSPHTGIYDLCRVIVEQRAPKFYLTPGSAEVIVSRIRKEWFRKQHQHLCRLS